MVYNIKNFLTEKSRPYYNKVQDILNTMQKTPGQQFQLYVFGGFLRDIICQYYNPDTKFSPKDIDVWIEYTDGKAVSLHRWGYYKSKEIIENLEQNHTVEKKVQSRVKSLYGLVRITVDSIQFDITTNINRRKDAPFYNLTDFTVNNLYMDMDGNIFKRIDGDWCPYTKNQIMLHIKHKKLVDMPFTYNDYICSDTFDSREFKMIQYGYRY